jgi:hypothetical protein
MDGSVALSLVAVVVSIVAVVFAGYQARLLAQQTRIQQAVAESSFNLELAAQLDSVLTRIAADPNAYAHVWGNVAPEDRPQDNRIGDVLTQALGDVIDRALAASERLPGFALNQSDWEAFADNVLDHSAALREATETFSWWFFLRRRLDARRTIT